MDYNNPGFPSAGIEMGKGSLDCRAESFRVDFLQSGSASKECLLLSAEARRIAPELQTTIILVGTTLAKMEGARV